MSTLPCDLRSTRLREKIATEHGGELLVVSNCDINYTPLNSVIFVCRNKEPKQV